MSSLMPKCSLYTGIFFVFLFVSPISANGEVKNTGLEFTSTMPSVYGNIIICRTGEASIGPRAVDLNNDGDFNDYVVRYYNISTGESFNSGAEAENGVPILWGANVVFTMREGYVAQDLNGDNDWNDDVCMYYDVSAHKLFTTKGETLSIRNPQISGNIIAFVTPELATGRDLDGDNSISNFVVRYFDIASGTLHNTGGTIYSSSNPVVSGNIIAFPTNERDYKTFLDLNGDGDNFDMVLMYYDVSSRALVNTGAVMLNFGYDVSGPIIAFLTFEGRIGADLNGDGDTSDTVARYFDVSNGKLANTGAEVATGTSPTVKDGLITFISNELFVGSAGKDLNGDGDTSDNILRYYDSSTGRLINTGAECSLPVALSNRKIIAFATDEAMVGRLGADLNGDGDTSDRIVRYYDLTTGTVVNTKAETWTELGLSDSIIAFGSAENRVGRFGEDLNGDGDKLDIVLRYILVGSVPPPTTTTTTTSTTTSTTTTTTTTTVPTTTTTTTTRPTTTTTTTTISLPTTTSSTTTTTTVPTTTITTTTTSTTTTTLLAQNICTDPSSLSFEATLPGPNPANQLLEVVECRRGNMNWSAQSNNTWLSVGQTEDPNVLNVSVDVSGIAADGVYNGSITIFAPGAANSPLQIPVTLNATRAPLPTKNLEARRVDDAILLKWDANDAFDLAGYKVYYDSDDSQPPYSGIGAVEGNSGEIFIFGTETAQLTGLPEGVMYVTVTAYDFEGNESNYSNVVIPNAVSIDNGNERIVSRRVTLYLTYGDSINRVSISNDGKRWSRWRTASRTVKNWYLSSGTGEKSVYVKFKSKDRIYEPAKDTILIEKRTRR